MGVGDEIVSHRPLVFVHGYSASSAAFDVWRQRLRRHGYRGDEMFVCDYVSLVHEVSIKDLGEAFQRAIAVHPGLADGAPFDAIVHSTGMLVVRAWLAGSAERRRQLRHLVALAPATFGSPLAHKGRSWLGAMVKGNRDMGPDFLAVGDEILRGLELASPFTWQLAHEDLVGDEAAERSREGVPYSFVLCGVERYPLVPAAFNELGSDGVVRLAGVALNARKIRLDLSLADDSARDQQRTVTAPWSSPDAPLVAIAGVNHSTIVSRPPDQLVELVVDALGVESDDAFDDWKERARPITRAALARRRDRSEWQQFVFRVVDERGDGVEDYYIDFVYLPVGKRSWRRVEDVRMKVHPNARDPSYRCFHIDLTSLAMPEGARLGVRLIASTGTHRVDYRGHSAGITMLADVESRQETRDWTAAIVLDDLERISFFYPFTTTLVELVVDREPVPFTGPNAVLWFADHPSRDASLAREAAKEAGADDELQRRIEAAYRRLVDGGDPAA